MSAPAGFYNYPLHREKHGWVKPSDCEWCARESHPSNVGRTPGNLAFWDQVAAREREESAAGGRALTFVVRVLAWVLFIALGVAGLAADVPTAITVLCCAVMFALLPLMFPRKARNP